VSTIKETKGINFNSISVDAACSGNPGVMEYRGVWTADGAELFHFGPARDGTNNIGEFLAIVHALALLHKKEDAVTPVYTDSKTAISWVRKKKANTQLKPNHHNKNLFDMIRRAEKWLKENEWKNPVLKWETERWGEIPADFGRK
jgi:ribonuclease HI